jgi:glutamate synthase (NADPH/NADH) small chain
MEKGILDARATQMRAEGVTFETGADVGGTLSVADLRERFDAVVLAIGARAPRDLPVPGRELSGVHCAMTFLEQQNRRVAGDVVPEKEAILATGKRVVVLGGGDTGSDCVGTSLRQRAASVLQLELMPRPPLVRAPANPWPEWPLVLRTSSSHEEGEAGDAPVLERDWAVMTKRLRGEDGRVVALEAARVEVQGGKLVELDGDALAIPCDLLLLAMGFVGPVRAGLVEQLALALDARGNVITRADGATNVPGVFACGDASRGQSLVVWAIADGRRVAKGVDTWLARAESPRPLEVSARP